jgi:hypothetical protein
MRNSASMNPKSTLLYSSSKSFIRSYYLINDQQLLIQCRDALRRSFNYYKDIISTIHIVFDKVKYLHVPTDFDGIEISVKEPALNDDECTVFSLKCLETGLTYIVTSGCLNIYENASPPKWFPINSNEKYCWWTKRDNFKHVMSYPSDCPSVLFSD